MQEPMGVLKEPRERLQYLCRPFWEEQETGKEIRENILDWEALLWREEFDKKNADCIKEASQLLEARLGPQRVEIRTGGRE